jgi:hypothetical protein
MTDYGGYIYVLRRLRIANLISCYARPRPSISAMRARSLAPPVNRYAMASAGKPCPVPAVQT